MVLVLQFTADVVAAVTAKRCTAAECQTADCLSTGCSSSSDPGQQHMLGRIGSLSTLNLNPGHNLDREGSLLITSWKHLVALAF